MELRAAKWGFGALGLAALALDLIGVAAAQDARPASHVDERGGPGGHRRPPAEAFNACDGKKEGAECQVQFRDRTLTGVCVAPNSEELFCMPNDMPPPPRDGERPPQER